MATRSTTSEYQPAPPFYRLKGGRRPVTGVAIVTSSSTKGTKSNCCAAPANSTTGKMIKLKHIWG
jgi:hypothetical protein